jgi:hypothetical protein
MLHARWHEVKQSRTPPTSRLGLQELLQTALELESDFLAWESTITPAWNYKVMPNTPENRSTYDAKWQNLFLGCRGAPEEIHSYPSMKRCWIWGFYRTSRIFLLRDMLEILNWMIRFPEPGPPFVSMESSRNASDTQGHHLPTALSNMNLRMRHAVATAHLVDIIEKNCSAQISSFTVPIHMKSDDDVVGMRGMICLWPLGIMDAVLSSGLVPDANAPNSPTSTAPAPAQSSAHLRSSLNVPPPSLVHATSTGSSSSLQSETSYATAPQFSELSNIRPKSESDQKSNASSSPLTSAPVLDPTAKKGHIFDSNPTHPYDHSLDLPPTDFDIIEPKRLDIAARREWLNRLLYYIASELGIKKALYIPLTEGFLPVVKPQVDYILGR